MELIIWIVIGFIAGTISGAIVPGRSPGGWLGTVVLGMLAGLIGGWVAKLVGLADTVTWLGSLALALIVCIAVLFLVRPDRSSSSA